ncbi:hypothetical protein Acsp05_60620 [Actinokineospora sp. NBRC 105648]|nr:hypothetical protein Acsp05_60620 [Actinokineospora sp. NBRC 105648]
MLRTGLAAALAAVVAAALASCETPADDAGKCSENRCELTVSGASTLEVLDARLKARVGNGQVRLTGGGVDVTLNPGEAAVVDGVRVELRAVQDGNARLVVSD